MFPAAQEAKANTAVYRWAGAGTPVVVRGTGVGNEPKGHADVSIRATL